MKKNRQSKPKVHVKKGDVVEIIAGRDKGFVSTVKKVNPRAGRVVVDGANEVTKHKKARSPQESGGIIHFEAEMDASNVLLYCDHCGRGVRTGKKITEDGHKVRYCKKCGAVLDEVGAENVK